MTSLPKFHRKKTSYLQNNTQIWPHDPPSPIYPIKDLHPICSMHTRKRSRKDRLKDQKTNQIIRNNMILYQKIKKIMMKDSNAIKKHQSFTQTKNTLNTLNQPIRKTTIDPPRRSHSPNKINNNFPSLNMKKTKSMLSSQKMLDSMLFRSEYQQNQEQRQQKLDQIKYIGTYQFYGWKIIAKTIEYGQILLLLGSKGKRTISKRYFYAKVKQKIVELRNLEQWIQHKFQYQI